MTACTYLTTDELSQRIKYDSRTIRDRLKDSVLLEGWHYIRPFGGRKTLYIWEQIEADMAQHSAVQLARDFKVSRDTVYAYLNPET